VKSLILVLECSQTKSVVASDCSPPLVKTESLEPPALDKTSTTPTDEKGQSKDSFLFKIWARCRVDWGVKVKYRGHRAMHHGYFEWTAQSRLLWRLMSSSMSAIDSCWQFSLCLIFLAFFVLLRWCVNGALQYSNNGRLAVLLCSVSRGDWVITWTYTPTQVEYSSVH